MEEKAASGLPTKSGALGLIMVITIVEAALSTLDSSVVSHLGCAVSARPVLKVVSLVAIAFREQEVRGLWTKSCITGVSKWMLSVLGVRWRKLPTLLLSEVTLIDSIVVIVIVFFFTKMVWIEIQAVQFGFHS